MNFRVIIPSKLTRNLLSCLRAVTEREPDLPTSSIIVIDDGIEPHARNLLQDKGVRFIDGAKPFVFARNVNLGFNRAFASLDAARFKDEPADGVIVLNDDALLMTIGGFTALARVASENPSYGAVSGVMRCVGNRNQWPSNKGLRDEPRIVCFVCVYLPRSTVEKVGPMDERFGGLNRRGETIYGFCDDDYCLRIRKVGLKLGIFDGCLVNHDGQSTFRGDHGCPLGPGREVFIEKWGAYPL